MIQQSWIYLVVAGIFEIFWIICLKYTEGFTQFVPLIGYAIFGFLSAFFLALSLKTLELGVAYSTWLGIAMIGATLFSIFYLNEPMSVSKFVFIGLIITGIIGLKVM